MPINKDDHKKKHSVPYDTQIFRAFIAILERTETSLLQVWKKNIVPTISIGELIDILRENQEEVEDFIRAYLETYDN